MELGAIVELGVVVVVVVEVTVVVTVEGKEVPVVALVATSGATVVVDVVARVVGVEDLGKSNYLQ